MESFIKDLEKRRSEGLYREISPYNSLGAHVEENGRSLLNFSSNDYLGLSARTELADAAGRVAQEVGVGALASRLVSGTHVLHEQFEERLANFFRVEACLLYGAGYLANLGLLSSICSRDDVIFMDKLAHASLVDGAILSRAKVKRFRHNDVSQLRELLFAASEERKVSERFIVVTESVFSMDGDLAPLEDLHQVAAEFSAELLVDEAHALGVFGECGRGLLQEAGLVEQVDYVSATMSKSFAGYGGVVLSNAKVREFLINCSRSFIYNTALPPLLAASNLASLDILEREPDLGSTLLAHAATFREALQSAGLNTLSSASQIVPLVVGDNEKVVAISRRLKELGILAVAMRSPTVPRGSERIRFSIGLDLSEEELRLATGTVLRVAEEFGIV